MTSNTTNTTTTMFRNKVAVITGGASGIGKALAVALAREGATVVVVDLRSSACETAAASLPRPFHQDHAGRVCDVTDPSQIRDMIRHVKQRYGRIDVYCSNAGIMFPPPRGSGDSVSRHSDDQWEKLLKIHLLSHVVAFRELQTDWETAQGGTFVVTASAAGLLTQIGDAGYGVSKAAAVSFCEHLAIAHPSVRVHCLCPQAVATALVDPAVMGKNSAATDGVLSADVVAACTLKAMRQNDFWVFPHPRVPEYVRRKATDHARWLKGMRRMRTALGFGNKSKNNNRPTSTVPASQIRSKL